jgi:hypothetical protein
MTFCTFQTNTLIAVGSIVKKDDASILPNDNQTGSILVGVVTRSYSNEDNTQHFAEVHLGGGVAFAKLSSAWDGTFSPLIVNNDGVEASTSANQYHGYLMPDLPPVAKQAGDLVPIYWRGAI